VAFSSALLMAGTASAVNIGHAISEKRDPYPTAIAGGIVIIALSFVSEWQSDLAVAFAACFLVGTFLLRGEKFFTWLAALVAAK